MLHATPSPRARDTVTGCTFTTKGVLKVITVVRYTTTIPCLIYFTPSNPYIFNEYKSSRSFKYERFSTNLGWHYTTDWW